MFRKESHASMMPALVRCAYRPEYHAELVYQFRVSMRVAKGAGVPAYAHFDVKRPRTDKISLGDILGVLRERWENATESDARATAEVLVQEKFLKTVGEIYFIIPEAKVQKDPLPGTGYPRFGGYWKERRKERHRGICPTCGCPTSNKNRHANSEHREKECKENRIKSVMES